MINYTRIKYSMFLIILLILIILTPAVSFADDNSVSEENNKAIESLKQTIIANPDDADVIFIFYSPLAGTSVCVGWTYYHKDENDRTILTIYGNDNTTKPNILTSISKIDHPSINIMKPLIHTLSNHSDSPITPEPNNPTPYHTHLSLAPSTPTPTEHHKPIVYI